MKQLTDLEFKKVGSWTLTNNCLNHSITSHLTETGLLYSFVSNNIVLYIGKTTDTLKSRMNGYKNAGGSQRTNIRVKGKIIELLNASKPVDVYILLDKVNLTYRNYKISLASGLEDNLIAALKPEWNFRGNIRNNDQEFPDENESPIIDSSLNIENKTKTVEIILGKEYWSKGFFNFSISELQLLPDKPTEVTLLLGHNDDVQTRGYFHFATQQNQPRVRGNKVLKLWFQENYKLGERIKIDILKSDLYRIY